MFRLMLAIGLALMGAGLVRGDPPPGAKPIRVDLHPSPPPAAALKYALLPHLQDMKPGNALADYHTAMMSMKKAVKALDDPLWYERVEKWNALPLQRLPCEQVRAFLKPLEPSLKLVEEACRHELMDWELTERIRKQEIGTLVPELFGAMESASFLALRTRLALAEGRMKDAHHDLQTMMAIARHTSQAPGLIGALVGVAIASKTAAEVDHWIQHPQAPNLYWALTDLPRPFVDLRLALEGEHLIMRGTFPGVPQSPREADKIMTPEEVQKAVQLAQGFQRDFDLNLPRQVYEVRLGVQLMKQHERAKKALVEEGWPREAVEKMPHVQVGLLYGFLGYDRAIDDSAKLNSLPYWEAASALLEAEKKVRRSRYFPAVDEPAFGFAAALGPPTGNVFFARTRLERKLAALRCLEAVRLYAAGHEGKLPGSLSAITEVPIPVDPFTGKPFEYTATGDRATLLAPAVARPVPGSAPDPTSALMYEIVMKK